jgi:hypothetical protein
VTDYEGVDMEQGTKTLGYCSDVSIPVWEPQTHQGAVDLNRKALAAFAREENLDLIEGSWRELPIVTKMSDGSTVNFMMPPGGSGTSAYWLHSHRERAADALQDIARSLREGVGSRPHREGPFPVAYRVAHTVQARERIALGLPSAQVC